jgi:hypothetical protein
MSTCKTEDISAVACKFESAVLPWKAITLVSVSDYDRSIGGVINLKSFVFVNIFDAGLLTAVVRVNRIDCINLFVATGVWSTSNDFHTPALVARRYS